MNFALREPSPSGEGGGLPTDEGLNSLCHKPLTTAARSLSPGRSLSFVPWRLPYKLHLLLNNFCFEAFFIELQEGAGGIAQNEYREDAKDEIDRVDGYPY